MANTWGNSGRLYFLGSKITADGDCSHEIKRCLLLGRQIMTNIDSILKSRDITWPTNVHLVRAIVFPVVMYGCESWTVKKAEPQRIDAFELRYWKRHLRIPWTARSNQSILKEINPEYSLEGLILKLKFWYFSHLCEELTHLKRPWCWQRVRVGGEGDDRGWDGWMALSTQWMWVWASSERWWRTGKPDMLQSMGFQRAGYNWAIEQQIKALNTIIFLMKSSCMLKYKNEQLLLCFTCSTQFFNVWLNRKQLDSHICFCFQSVTICFGKACKENLASCQLK